MLFPGIMCYMSSIMLRNPANGINIQVSPAYTHQYIQALCMLACILGVYTSNLRKDTSNFLSKKAVVNRHTAATKKKENS